MPTLSQFGEATATAIATANHLLGRGDLAMAAILACGALSAVCGSSLATAATISKVAMPSLRKYGYADSLATGAIERAARSICSYRRAW